MIGYKDFIPQRIAARKGGFFGGSTPEGHQTFRDAVAEANVWIGAEGVEVVSVETVVLPNVWEDHEDGTDDGSLYASGSGSSWHQFVRVWYRVG